MAVQQGMISGKDSVRNTLYSQLRRFLSDDGCVFEFGCGDGTFLLGSADVIRVGYGVDYDRKKIRCASERAAYKGIGNIKFDHFESHRLKPTFHFDHGVCICSLSCLPVSDILSLLQGIRSICDKIIVCDYTVDSIISYQARLKLGRLVYRRYAALLRYKDAGGLPGILENSGMRIMDTHRTAHDGLLVWEVQ